MFFFFFSKQRCNRSLQHSPEKLAMCVHSSITPFMKLIDSLCKDGRWHSAASVLLPCALYPPRPLRRQKKWPCKNSFTSLNNETFSLAYSYSINDVTLLHPSVKCLWLWKLPAEAWHTWSSYYFPHCMLLCTITYSVYYSALYTIKWMHFTFLPLFSHFPAKQENGNGSRLLHDTGRPCLLIL